jgi:hypothetical protein
MLLNPGVDKNVPAVYHAAIIGVVGRNAGSATYPFRTRGRAPMTFDEILTQVLDLLQREKRLS